MIDLKPVTVLRGVGEALAARLRALGVETTQDLLFLLPLRYEDRTRIVPLGELRPGQRAAVEGEVLLTEVAFRGRRQMLCRIGDGSGFLTLRFFYFTAQQHKGLARGARVRCFGEARRGPKGLEIVHPEYRRVDPRRAPPPRNTSRRSIPSRKGMTQGRLRQLVELALDQTGASELEDWLPPALLADSRLPSLREALLYVHRPPADAPVDLLIDWRHPAQRRLAFEELLAHQLSLKLLRRRIQQRSGLAAGGRRRAEGRPSRRVAVSPDAAQQRVLREIEQDLRRREAHAAAGAGRCGLRQNAGGGVGGDAGHSDGTAGRADGADRITRRSARAKFPPLVRAARRRRALLTGRLTGKARGTVLERHSRGLRPRSSSARTPCSRRASRSPRSPWWSSMSSTASACISACPCAKRAPRAAISRTSSS